MKKIYILALLSVMCFLNVKGQTFKDNFDSYTAGDWLGPQSSMWTTWSGNEGSSGTDDVLVDNSDAFSGKNSLYFNGGAGPEDVLLDFGGEYNEGVFVFSQRMKIPSGKAAYFNFQSSTKPGTGWATDLYFETNGAIRITNSSTLKPSYPQGQWFEIKLVISLDMNIWQVYINNQYKGSYSSSLNTIATLDLYPATSNDQFWVDDVYFKYYPPGTNDAGAMSIDSPAVYCANVTRNVYATVRNFGNNVLDSLTINWSLNGKTQTPVKYKTKIDTTNSTKGNSAKIKLGTVFFKSTADTIKVWTSLPNGKTDTVPFFDTVMIIKKPVPPPTVDAGQDADMCVGSSAKIGTTVSSGMKYSWTSNPPGFTANTFNAIVTPSVTTTYKLVVTSTASGCSSEDSVTITVKDAAKVQADVDKTICQGDSVNLGTTSDTNLTYSWTSNPAGFTSNDHNPVVKPTVTTTYKVVATHKNGCKAEDEITITVNPLPNAVAGVDKTICLGTSVAIGRSPVVGYTYDWRSIPSGFSSNSSNPTVSPKDTTTYIVKVTNSTNCTMEDTVVVMVSPLPIANAGEDTIICSGGSVKLGAPALTGHTYTWSSIPAGFNSFTANPTVSPKVNTKYRVVIRNSDGCLDDDTVEVKISPNPTANAGTAKSVCIGDSVKIGSTPTTGYTYSWVSVPAGFTSTDAEPFVKPTATTTYKLIVKNELGCASTEASVTVTVKPLPVPDAGAPKAVCPGGSVQIGTPAVAGLTYNWTSIPSGFTSTDAQPTVTPGETTTYILKVTNADGCSAIDDVTVNVNNPTAGFTINANGLKVVFTSDNTTYKTYEWNFRDGNTDTGRIVTHNFNASGTYNVRLKVTDHIGCTTTEDSAITISGVGFNDVEAPVSGINLYPNPFTKATTLTYTLPKQSKVNIALLDVTGKQIAELVNTNQSSGTHTYNINSADHNLKPGIYFVQMQVEGSGTTRKIMKVE